MRIKSVLLAIKNKEFKSKAKSRIRQYRLRIIDFLIPEDYTIEIINKSLVKQRKTVSYDFRVTDFLDDYVRIASLKMISDDIKSSKIPGCVAELGVYRGDFAKHINAFFEDRKLYLFDTYEGFVQSDLDSEVENGYSNIHDDFSGTSEEIVLKKMKYPEKCVIRKGYFPDTTSGLESERFCFVSLDADLYEPIFAGLSFFYPRMNPRGVIFIHDYNNPQYNGTKQAVRRFSAENGVGVVCLPDVYGTAVIVKSEAESNS